ncbi:MAG: putative aminohydrolase SsnA [Ignavibacteriales bacterium]|nr:putative aminohydrolase SsnA [Ignavibacteriales bacterium]
MVPTKTLLINNGIIVTLGKKNHVLSGHSILVNGGSIESIAPSAEFSGSYDAVVDAHGGVMLPGFINAHMHYYSTMARGLGKAEPASDFAGVLNNLWWRLDKALTLEDCYFSTLVILLDAIRHGTTTLIDHHASPHAVTGSLNEIAKAATIAGVRSCLCYEVSDRDGAGIARQGLDENESFIRRCREERNPLLRAMFGLHASFTLSDETLENAAARGKMLNSGFHIHVAEAESDQQYSEKHFGMRVVDRLQKFGILGRDSIAAHCVHVSDREMQILSETGTSVVHNPQSNMNNAVGVADIVAMQKKGIRVGLGTDAITVNMLEELRAALWAQHLLHRDPSVGFMECVNTLFSSNAAIASNIWGLPLGGLSEGAAADVVIVNYQPPTPFVEDTVFGHLVFGIPHASIATTIVNGRVLMQDGELKIDVDEKEVTARSRELAAALWKRF